MKKNKIKVLQFSIASTMGGRSRYILENWKHINHDLFQFDFVTFSNKISVERELETQGCTIYHFSCYPKDNKEMFVEEWNRILDNGYDIVHLNTSYWDGFLLEECAYKKGVKKIIVHSHNTGIGKQMSNEERERYTKQHFELQETLDFSIITDFWACSKVAAEWLFGDRVDVKDVFITYPTIDVKDYVFDEQKREAYREQLGIDKEFLIGTVGRIVYQKNHEFLLRCFAGVFKENKKIKLLIIGSGELQEQLQNLAKQLEIDKQLIIVSNCKDIIPYYQAMDLFVLPSRYEGFPKVVLEAVATGLKCICSDTITEEIEFCDRVNRIALSERAWINKIKFECENGIEKREDMLEFMKYAGFDIFTEIKQIEKQYMILNEERGC